MLNALSHFHFSVPVSLFFSFFFGSFLTWELLHFQLPILELDTNRRWHMRCECACVSVSHFHWLGVSGWTTLKPPDPLCTYRCHQSFPFGSISMVTKRPFAQNTTQQIYWVQPWLPMGWRGKKVIMWLLIFTFFPPL